MGGLSACYDSSIWRKVGERKPTHTVNILSLISMIWCKERLGAGGAFRLSFVCIISEQFRFLYNWPGQFCWFVLQRNIEITCFDTREYLVDHLAGWEICNDVNCERQTDCPLNATPFIPLIAMIAKLIRR